MSCSREAGARVRMPHREGSGASHRSAIPVRLRSQRGHARPVLLRSTVLRAGGSVLPTLREACGVFGVYAPGEEVARITFFGLYALQHRGQESAGIATSNSRTLYLKTGMGLVSQVFDE